MLKTAFIFINYVFPFFYSGIQKKSAQKLRNMHRQKGAINRNQNEGV